MEKLIWKLHIQQDEIPWIHKNLLGLSFFERRLREAKKLVISHVYVLVPSSIKEKDLPIVKKQYCASWSIVHQENDIPLKDNTSCYSVSVLSLIENVTPFRPRWIIKNEKDFQLAKTMIIQDIVEKSRSGWIGKKINKRISLLISTRIVSSKVTANQWSFVNLWVGLLSAYCVSQPAYGWVLAGGFLFQLASVFDGIDGEIAKFRLEASEQGAWIDTIVDNISLLAFLFGMGIHYIHASYYTPSTLWMLLSMAGVSVVFLLSFLFYFIRVRLHSGSLVAFEAMFLNQLPDHDFGIRIIKHARMLIKKDFFSFLFFSFCAMGWIQHLLLIISFGPLIALLSLFYIFVKFRKEYSRVNV